MEDMSTIEGLGGMETANGHDISDDDCIEVGVMSAANSDQFSALSRLPRNAGF